MNASKKIIIILSALTILILAASIYTYFKYIKEYKRWDGSMPFTQENFKLETQYQGNSTWTYTVTGILPNQCYQVLIDSTVMESYPEQVNITAEIQQISKACTQAIQNVKEEGTFNASEQAKITFTID